jgi:hypothetical protein
MDLVLSLINEYDQKKSILLQDYKHFVNTKFGSDLEKHIYESYNKIINTDKYIERYLRLFNYYNSDINDEIVKEMIFEKLQNEYDTILLIQKDIIIHLKFSSADNMNIESLLMLFEKITGFISANQFKNHPVYNILLRIQQVHKTNAEIFMNTYENCKNDDYNKEVFKLTDSEIIIHNEEILQRSKINKNINNIELNNIKCSNE